MDNTNYRFYKDPRFSANQLAEYLCTTDPGQREGVIRRAKFPRKPNVIAYSQIIPSLRSYLTSNIQDAQHFDSLLTRLRDKARREEGYNRDEALRCIAAIEAFLETAPKLKVGRAKFLAGPQDVMTEVEGVSINARLDPPMMETCDDGRLYSGGCMPFLANSPEARKNIDERRKIVSAIVYWVLDLTKTNTEPTPRLCLSFDTFGREITRAPDAKERLRKRMTAGCRETAARWDRIEPPVGYDGPNWR